MEYKENIDKIKEKYISCKEVIKEWEKEYISSNGIPPDKSAVSSSSEVVRKAYKDYWQCKKLLIKNKSPALENLDYGIKVSKCKEGLDNNNANTSENSDNVFTGKSGCTATSNILSTNAQQSSVWNFSLNRQSNRSAVISDNKDSLYVKMASKMRLLPIVSSKISLKPFKRVNNAVITCAKGKSTYIEFNSSDWCSSAYSDISCSPATFDVLNYFDKTSLPDSAPPKVKSYSVSSINLHENPVSCTNIVDLNWLDRCFIEKEKSNTLIIPDRLKSKPNRQNPVDSECAFTLQQDHSDKIVSSNEFMNDDFISACNIAHSDTSCNTLLASKTVVDTCSNSPCAQNNFRNQGVLIKDNVLNNKDICKEYDEINISPGEMSAANKPTSKTKTFKNPKSVSDKEKALARKLAKGDNNYVKINLRKKCYAPHKKNISYSKYKQQQWKKNKTGKFNNLSKDAKSLTCFKCGEFGHWARSCITTGKKST